jgi:hypothetical protein
MFFARRFGGFLFMHVQSFLFRGRAVFLTAVAERHGRVQ